MLTFLQRLTRSAGVLAAWMLFTIGLMITYEVIMRKAFNAPTVWVDEIARFFQIWAVYLASAYVLANRQLISVELFSAGLHKRLGRFTDFLTLAIIAIFCLTAIWYGTAIVVESIEQDRHTSTMLGVPRWMTETAIPASFLLLLLQTIAEAVLLIRGGPGTSISAASDIEEISK